jgi:hypothetical protein
VIFIRFSLLEQLIDRIAGGLMLNS